MLEGRRGGERRQHAPQSVCTRRLHERSSHALRGRVLHSVLRPVLVNPHYALRRKVKWWGERVGITVGQTRATGRNQHWGRHERTSARLVARHRLAREGRDVFRKGRRSRPPSLRGSRESRFGCPHVEVQLQKSVGDVWPRISSAYALQKERTGSSERGPSSKRWSVGETVGSRVERKERRESASPV